MSHVLGRSLESASHIVAVLMKQMTPVFATLQKIAFHRDISAHNFLIDECADALKFAVLDFGLAVRSGGWKHEWKAGPSATRDPIDPLAPCGGLNSAPGIRPLFPAAAVAGRYLENNPKVYWQQQYASRLDHYAFGILICEVFFGLWKGPEEFEGNPLDDETKGWRKTLLAARTAWRKYWTTCVGLFQRFHSAGAAGIRHYLAGGHLDMLGEQLHMLVRHLVAVADSPPGAGHADSGAVCKKVSMLLKAAGDLVCPKSTFKWQDCDESESKSKSKPLTEWGRAFADTTSEELQVCLAELMDEPLAQRKATHTRPVPRGSHSRRRRLSTAPASTIKNAVDSIPENERSPSVSDESVEEDDFFCVKAFPEKHWDVTNIQEFLGGGLLCLWPKKELTLEREEAVLRVTTTCSSSTQRRPYAQLTMVEQRSACFGVCAGINSDRGRDTMSKIGVQVPMLLKHFAVQYPPEASTIQQIFGSAAPLFRPWKNAVAEREPEDGGGRVTTKVPYANIESVEAEQSCGCSSLTAGELTEHHAIQPGTGCSMDIVEAIRTELQRRVDARGNRRQINQLEESKRGGRQYLPRQSDQHQEASRQFETKTYDVLNQALSFRMPLGVQNVCNFICTCGPTKHTVTLTQEEVVTERSNNCCSSTERKPYAQIQEVDAGVCCFCCHGVNGMSPGWCGDEALVNELAQELQDTCLSPTGVVQNTSPAFGPRRVVALDGWPFPAQHESDIRCDILLHQQQIEYPPSQATMSGIYGAQAPTLPPASGPRGQDGRAPLDGRKAMKKDFHSAAPVQELHLSASEKMENKMFHIATWCDAYCCCAEHTLELNDEEAVFHLKNCCMDSWSREPYAQLGSVEPAEACNHTCVGVSMLGGACVGHEWEEPEDENLMIEIIKLGVKLDLLLHKCGLSFPPSQAFMDETFGAGSHLPAAQPPPPERRGSKTLVTVKVPMGLRPGDSFPVTTPQGQVQAVVPHGAVEGQEIQVEIPRQPIVSSNKSDDADKATRSIELLPEAARQPGWKKSGHRRVWTLDTSATLTKDVVPVGIGFSNGELVEALRLEDSRGFSMENPESKVGRTMSEHEKEPHIFRWK
eukprot:g8629.t1